MISCFYYTTISGKVNSHVIITRGNSIYLQYTQKNYYFMYFPPPTAGKDTLFRYFRVINSAIEQFDFCSFPSSGGERTRIMRYKTAFVDIHNNTGPLLCKRQKFALRTSVYISRNKLRSAGKCGAELFIRGFRAFDANARNAERHIYPKAASVFRQKMCFTFL